ncbi:hypothetical protein [Vreelandella aquamarina]|uniref:Uncharacterized protein n=1 Tax=Vreelandella aquamarina TaxID=77097 RepID=A0A857GIT1_9GAMM|nr:hypothetical protein [Halomonas meridiana]QHD48467.1 hypothetical protein CTT34_01520 [Halomonas meridiana]
MQLTPTHIEILKRAVPLKQTEIDVSQMDATFEEVIKCCEELEQESMLDFEDPRTQLGTNRELPSFKDANQKIWITIYPAGLRAIGK